MRAELRPELEAELQGKVVELARLRGWRIAHFRPARTDRGWRTPVAGDGAGFPDLTLVRDRLIFAELKSDRGRPSPAQTAWLEALTAAGVEAYLWRPRDWEAIVEALT